MIHELIVKDKAIEKKELLQFFYNSAKGSKIDNLCLSTSLIHYFSEIKGYVNIVGLIDYPYGLACTKARAQDIDFAVKAGCKTVDIVLNSAFIINDDLDLVDKDIRICQTKTLPYNIELRAIIDYRITEKHLEDLCTILFPLGITTIITSTGTMPDDTIDNLVVSEHIKQLGMDVIVCGITRSIDDYRMIKKQGLHGIRFASINAAKNILGQLV